MHLDLDSWTMIPAVVDYSWKKVLCGRPLPITSFIIKRWLCDNIVIWVLIRTLQVTFSESDALRCPCMPLLAQRVHNLRAQNVRSGSDWRNLIYHYVGPWAQRGVVTTAFSTWRWQNDCCDVMYISRDRGSTNLYDYLILVLLSNSVLCIPEQVAPLLCASCLTCGKYQWCWCWWWWWYLPPKMVVAQKEL